MSRAHVKTQKSQNPHAAVAVQALLEKHPGYAYRWRDENAKLPEAQRSEALFMWAAHWADDIRTQARLQGEVVWYYIRSSRSVNPSTSSPCRPS